MNRRKFLGSLIAAPALLVAKAGAPGAPGTPGTISPEEACALNNEAGKIIMEFKAELAAEISSNACYASRITWVDDGYSDDVASAFWLKNRRA